MKPKAFEAGLRKDVAKRLRAAHAKLCDRLISVEIDRARARDAKDEAAARELLEEHVALEMHTRALRYALAWFAVHDDLYVSEEAEAALATAEQRRTAWAPRPLARPPTPPKPVEMARRLEQRDRQQVSAQIQPADLPRAQHLLSQLNDGPTAAVRFRSLSIEVTGDAALAGQLLLGRGVSRG